MPIIYQHQPDEAITWRTLKFEEDSAWWAGVQQCAATIAIAAVLTATSFTAELAQTTANQHQDDPAGSLFVNAQPEEFYWQNPTAPVPATLTYPQQWPFEQNEPAGSLLGQPEELYWQQGPSPVPATLLWPQQSSFDVQEPAGSLIGQPEEVYWQNPVAPVPATISWTQQYGFDSSEVPPQPITFSPDEDYWQGGTRLMQSVSLMIAPWTSDSGDLVPSPPVSKQNYIATMGTHNFVSQEIGTGVEF